jgi:DNA invertase Pin-like site-specific DNA recombinase
MEKKGRKYKQRKERYILQRDGVELGRATSLQGIADILEIGVATIYRTIQPDNTFKFRKKIYTIIDKFDLI